MSSPQYDIDVEILKELRREQTSTNPPDEDELFGQSVGATLKTMAPQQKSLAKLRIQQVMYEIQYCNAQPSPSSYFPSAENATF